MAQITLEGVGKIYPGGTRAIHDVSMTVEDGEFVVLVGPSGCGKSTLLRMVAGLEEITEGEIHIGDRLVNGVPAKDRDIAMVFQNYALYPHMSVEDNAAFALKLRKMEKQTIKERVLEAAKTLDIGALLERKPGALSGGQRQRVAMSRAIVREPSAFLMDEPLSNLDAKLRVQMRAELGRLHARLKTTTLYVTHDQVEAMTMGDRVAVLRAVNDTSASNLQQLAPPKELYDRPANLFVAGFIGSPSMNFVNGRITADGPRTYVEFAGEKLRLTQSYLDANPGMADYAGQDVVLGFRPESFEILPAVSSDVDTDERVLDVKIELTEQLGSEAFVHFDVNSPPVVTPELAELMAEDGTDVESLGQTTAFTARIDPWHAPEAPAAARLFLDTDRMHVFDPATGAAIH